MAAPRNLGAIGSGGSFPGFTAADFNAYEPKKQGSNAYTLERRKAKDKLLSLARSLQEELKDELSGMEIGASDEAPTVSNARKVEAQWVFFTRGGEERNSLRTLLMNTDLKGGAGLFDIAVQHQHAVIMLRLDQQGLTTGFEIATKAKVDRDNAAEKLKQPWARDKVVELAKGLPNGATIGFAKDRKDPLAINAGEIEAWIEPFTKPDLVFIAETTIARTEEILAAPALIGTVVEQAETFLPLYRLLAWARDNDHTQVKKGAQKQEVAQREQKRAAFEPGDRVTILSGLFAGRSGYLAELDGKGRAKVMVGPVSVGVDAKDLKPS